MKIDIAESGNGSVHFVTFKVGGHDYALPLLQVECALRMVSLMPVPDAPPWLAGLLNLHGRVMQTLDLKRCLGGKSRNPHPDDRLLVIDNNGKNIAVIVDEVNDVLEMPMTELEAPTGAVSKSRPLKGIIRNDDQLVLVLDPERLEPESLPIT